MYLSLYLVDEALLHSENVYTRVCTPVYTQRVHTVTGIVQKGAQRGHELGYPTINIPFFNTNISGIYAARVYIKDEAPYLAAAFADPKRGVLEAHLLDFEDDLYGMEATIELLEKIRDAARYESDAALKAAIGDDIAKVHRYFGTI